MLTLLKVGYVIPVCVIAYSGLRQLFGQDVGLAARLTIAIAVFVYTAMAKIFSDTLQDRQLSERRQEQTKECVTANL